MVAFVFAIAASAAQQTPKDDTSRELLYIVDSDHGNSDSHERVFSFDPEHKAIVRNYSAGAHPDIALSPDGTRLYLAYDEMSPDRTEGQGKLDVVDTATGAVVASVANPNRWMAMGPFYNSEMVLSADGRWLFLKKLTLDFNHLPVDAIATFDTATNKFLPDTISLPKCAASLFMPWPDSHRLSVLCSQDLDLRTIHFNDQGLPANLIPVGIPVTNHSAGQWVGTAFVSGNDQATVIAADGKHSRINVETGKIVEEGAIAFSPPLTPAGWHPRVRGAEHTPSLGRRYVGMQRALQTGGLLYLSLSRSDLFMHAADSMAVLDEKTLQQKGFFELKNSQRGVWNLFWSAATGEDGTRLYLFGIEPKAGSLHVLSLPAAKEIDTIKGLGATPTILIAVP
jgi:hypothetical protein